MVRRPASAHTQLGPFLPGGQALCLLSPCAFVVLPLVLRSRPEKPELRDGWISQASRGPRRGHGRVGVWGGGHGPRSPLPFALASAPFFWWARTRAVTHRVLLRPSVSCWAGRSVTAGALSSPSQAKPASNRLPLRHQKHTGNAPKARGSPHVHRHHRGRPAAAVPSHRSSAQGSVSIGPAVAFLTLRWLRLTD